MNNYKHVKIGELGEIITGRTPPTDDHSNYGNDYRFFGPADLHKHYFIDESEKMISEKGFNVVKSCALDDISILVGCIGWDMGNVGIVKGKCITNQQINSITKIKPKYNPLYIYYWLKNNKNLLFQKASVTRTPILNKTKFSNILINIPEGRTEQDKIVSILEAIDKKIEINENINKNLEKQMELIYNYWFIQFDFPDRDNKPYKTSAGKINYNQELKKDIPIDWDVVKISDLCEIATDTINPLEFPDKTFNYFSIPLFDQVKTYAQEKGLNIASSKYKLTEKDIIVSKLNPRVNRVVFIQDIKDQICSTEFVVWRTKSNSIKSFLYMVAKSERFISHCIQSAGGTSNSHRRVTPEVMTRLKIPFNHMIVKKFGSMIEPMIRKIVLNNDENVYLNSLKDWLLPMLMNGQISIRDAEEHIAKTFEQNG